MCRAVVSASATTHTLAIATSLSPESDVPLVWQLDLTTKQLKPEMVGRLKLVTQEVNGTVYTVSGWRSWSNAASKKMGLPFSRSWASRSRSHGTQAHACLVLTARRAQLDSHDVQIRIIAAAQPRPRNRRAGLIYALPSCQLASQRLTAQPPPTLPVNGAYADRQLDSVASTGEPVSSVGA